MSDTPYIPFYTSDFLGGTSGMTAATKGVYITLLCLMYEVEGPLEQQWDTLARRCGCTLPAFKKAVEVLQDDGKLTVEDGRLWSNTIERWTANRRKDGTRPAIPLGIQRDVLAEGFCSYCGTQAGPFEIDHVLPWSRGGTHDRENLTLACKQCNRSKGAKTIEEWLQ